MDFESTEFLVFLYVLYLGASVAIAYWGWVNPGVLAGVIFFMATVNVIACSLVGIAEARKYFKKRSDKK